MGRKLVWIEEPGFGGFGCSECGWRFRLFEEPTGTSFDAMRMNFALQRDRAFTLHVCVDSSKRIDK